VLSQERLCVDERGVNCWGRTYVEREREVDGQKIAERWMMSSELLGAKMCGKREIDGQKIAERWMMDW